MTLRRLNRKPKGLAAKGKPGTMNRRVSVRKDPATGKPRSFHPTKGWRRFE